MTKSLRDWRNLEGFEPALDKMRDLRAREKLPPVLLLEGHEGIGKSILAAAVAALYTCETGTACGSCGSCQEIMNDRHNDVIWIAPDDDRIKLEHAVEFQNHLHYNPEQARNRFAAVRIAVAVNIDKMLPQAANRLLKILEEPPLRARIILTTSHYNNLLATIRSRCVKWHLRLPTDLVGDPRQALDKELSEEMRAFLMCRNESDAVVRAQRILKNYNLSASALVRTAELVLNQYYREICNKPDQIQRVDVVRVRRRREQLGELRRMAERQQVALNPQLSMESLVVTN